MNESIHIRRIEEIRLARIGRRRFWFRVAVIVLLAIISGIVVL